MLTDHRSNLSRDSHQYLLAREVGMLATSYEGNLMTPGTKLSDVPHQKSSVMSSCFKPNIGVACFTFNESYK